MNPERFAIKPRTPEESIRLRQRFGDQPVIYDLMIDDLRPIIQDDIDRFQAIADCYWEVKQKITEINALHDKLHNLLTKGPQP